MDKAEFERWVQAVTGEPIGPNMRWALTTEDLMKLVKAAPGTHPNAAPLTLG